MTQLPTPNSQRDSRAGSPCRVRNWRREFMAYFQFYSGISERTVPPGLPLYLTSRRGNRFSRFGVLPRPPPDALTCQRLSTPQAGGTALRIFLKLAGNTSEPRPAPPRRPPSSLHVTLSPLSFRVNRAGSVLRDGVVGGSGSLLRDYLDIPELD